MGRRERPIEPTAGPLQAFAFDLRLLRAKVGGPSYRKLAQKAGFSASALSAAASGVTLPSRQVTLAYVNACGGDTSDWAARWEGLRDEAKKAAIDRHPRSVKENDEEIFSPAVLRVDMLARRRYRWLAAYGVGTFLGLAVATAIGAVSILGPQFGVAAAVVCGTIVAFMQVAAGGVQREVVRRLLARQRARLPSGAEKH